VATSVFFLQSSWSDQRLYEKALRSPETGAISSRSKSKYLRY